MKTLATFLLGAIIFASAGSLTAQTKSAEELLILVDHSYEGFRDFVALDDPEDHEDMLEGFNLLIETNVFDEYSLHFFASYDTKSNEDKEKWGLTQQYFLQPVEFTNFTEHLYDYAGTEYRHIRTEETVAEELPERPEGVDIRYQKNIFVAEEEFEAWERGGASNCFNPVFIFWDGVEAGSYQPVVVRYIEVF